MSYNCFATQEVVPPHLQGKWKVPSSSLSLFHPNIPDQAVPRWNCWGRIWFVWNQAAKWLGIRYLGCQGHLQCGQGLPKSFNQCLVAKSFQPILNHRFQQKGTFPLQNFPIGGWVSFQRLLGFGAHVSQTAFPPPSKPSFAA